MGKRRHETEDDDIEVVDSFVKKAKLDETLASNEVQANGDFNHIDVWLVRKPRSVENAELENMRFPKKIKPSTSEKKLQLSLGTLDCTFEKPSKSMFHFRVPSKKGEKNHKVHVEKGLKGVAFLRLPEQVEDPFPQAVEDDFDLMDIKIEETCDPVLPFKLKSIRKQPACIHDVKERLTAFGVPGENATEVGVRKSEKSKKHRRHKYKLIDCS